MSENKVASLSPCVVPSSCSLTEKKKKCLPEKKDLIGFQVINLDMYKKNFFVIQGKKHRLN